MEHGMKEQVLGGQDLLPERKMMLYDALHFNVYNISSSVYIESLRNTRMQRPRRHAAERKALQVWLGAEVLGDAQLVG